MGCPYHFLPRLLMEKASAAQILPEMASARGFGHPADRYTRRARIGRGYRPDEKKKERALENAC
jgi:hypothetical protein